MVEAQGAVGDGLHAPLVLELYQYALLLAYGDKATHLGVDAAVGVAIVHTLYLHILR